MLGVDSVGYLWDQALANPVALFRTLADYACFDEKGFYLSDAALEVYKSIKNSNAFANFGFFSFTGTLSLFFAGSK